MKYSQRKRVKETQCKGLEHKSQEAAKFFYFNSLQVMSMPKETVNLHMHAHTNGKQIPPKTLSATKIEKT